MHQRLPDERSWWAQHRAWLRHAVVGVMAFRWQKKDRPMGGPG